MLCYYYLLLGDEEDEATAQLLPAALPAYTYGRSLVRYTVTIAREERAEPRARDTL